MSSFSDKRVPKETDHIVYINASCDILHPGVIDRLEKAKACGDFLYVGVPEDEMITYYRG
jgi:bifunctional ADP-heptose synthase (sugar kinase/adenylyltransferase)